MRLLSTIVSDDCRREDNGKDIIIGVYTEGIHSAQIPFVLPTLSVRFEILPTKLKYEHVKLILKNTIDENMSVVTGRLEFNKIDSRSAFFFKFGPVTFTKYGQNNQIGNIWQVASPAHA
jgi:hypothetical protein